MVSSLHDSLADIFIELTEACSKQDLNSIKDCLYKLSTLLKLAPQDVEGIPHYYSLLEYTDGVIDKLSSDKPEDNHSTHVLKQLYTCSQITAMLKDVLEPIRGPVKSMFIGRFLRLLIISILVLWFIHPMVAIYNNVMYQPKSVNIDTKSRSAVDFVNPIKTCKKQYYFQNEDVWANIVAGLTDMHEFDTVATFLILHNNSPATANCISDVISKISRKHVIGSRFGPSILHADNSISPFKGSVINYILPFFNRSKILIVNNFEKVSSQHVTDFHFICDFYNPLVKQSVVILIMNVQEKLNVHNAVEIAEKSMKKLWIDKIEDEILNSLITRLVSYPLIVYPEVRLPSNCCEV